MAFRKEILEAVLPFPNDIRCTTRGSDGERRHWANRVSPDRLVFYRRHESNVTVGRHGTVESMFAQRWALTKNLICRMGTLVRVRRKLSSGRINS